MENISKGDIILFIGDDEPKTTIREEIVGRAGNVVFTRTLLENGAVSSINPPQLIEDLITFGWIRGEVAGNRELTIGEKMVGLDFNPANNPDVHWVKETCAKLIDRVEDSKGEKPSYVRNMIAGQAQRAILVVQMLVVKAITLPEGQ